MLIEGRHFAADADPRRLGHKALAVNLSDLAAMGAAPRWALLAIALPSADESWVAGFSAGLYELAERHAVDLVGGDTTQGPLRSITITAIGEVPAGVALYRAGARAGDDIWVSGEIGGAAFALRHPGNPAADRRLNEPEPRIELGERLRGLAHAAIDISDGLAGDLGHILASSQAGAIVHFDKLPIPDYLKDTAIEERMHCALSGGEDYELLFSAAPEQRQDLEALSVELGLRLTLIGSIHNGPAILQVLDSQGRPMRFRGGFEHFSA